MIDLIQIKAALATFCALFPVINPLGLSLIFLELTDGLNSNERKLLALRISINIIIMLTICLFFGQDLLALFAIKIPALKLGGGLIVATMGWKLLQQNQMNNSEQHVTKSKQDLMGQSFFPLTLPFTAGPGAITITITIGASHTFGPEISISSMRFAELIGLILVAISVFFFFGYAEWVVKSMSQSAKMVVLKLFAFVLFCIGVTITAGGVTDYIHDLIPAHSGQDYSNSSPNGFISF